MAEMHRRSDLQVGGEISLRVSSADLEVGTTVRAIRIYAVQVNGLLKRLRNWKLSAVLMRPSPLKSKYAR